MDTSKLPKLTRRQEACLVFMVQASMQARQAHPQADGYVSPFFPAMDEKDQKIMRGAILALVEKGLLNEITSDEGVSIWKPTSPAVEYAKLIVERDTHAKGLH